MGQQIFVFFGSDLEIFKKRNEDGIDILREEWVQETKRKKTRKSFEKWFEEKTLNDCWIHTLKQQYEIIKPDMPFEKWFYFIDRCLEN